ncbi:uncharacterized protein LOC120539776 [Polypterus senegalus]|uniref:uncharacterized protein LOC120539776 n=1 Tax=Polypterus senegalus TaxID=55291 RepID=UPI0019644B5C|nr:uncharacterized protein LOC120539776 [Polypterus senegalus]
MNSGGRHFYMLLALFAICSVTLSSLQDPPGSLPLAFKTQSSGVGLEGEPSLSLASSLWRLKQDLLKQKPWAQDERKMPREANESLESLTEMLLRMINEEKENAVGQLRDKEEDREDRKRNQALISIAGGLQSYNRQKGGFGFRFGKK